MELSIQERLKDLRVERGLTLEQLAEPCKSRLFPLLTVHSRPPFPFTFCFLPPVNYGGTVGAVFRPV